MAKVRLKDIELFLMDMDGTIYHENELIPGALEFFELLKKQNKRYAFMTNNSSKGKITYVEKLRQLGITASEDMIASSVNATVHYLNCWKPGAKIYLVGTESFRRELLDEGFSIVPVDYRASDIDCVLLGYDTELTYAKIVGACYYVSRGYEYLATNCDLKCPVVDNRYVPDCAAIAGMIKAAAGRMPKFLGKPNRELVDAVASKWGVGVDRIACVGDRLYTDIQVGVNAGCTTICVLTGEATEMDIERCNSKPDYVFPSVRELMEAVRV